MEFLLVTYRGNDCEVIIDGISGAWVTNQVLILGAGHHLVTLSKPRGTFAPPEREVDLYGTSPQHPTEVIFT